MFVDDQLNVTGDRAQVVENHKLFTMRLLFSFLLLLLITTRLVQVGRGQTSEWCVASEQAPNDALQEALDWACSDEGGADCSLIQPAGSCFFPDTVRDHASFAFNDYWQKFKSKGGTCDFKGVAVLVQSNPSHDLCAFATQP